MAKRDKVKDKDAAGEKPGRAWAQALDARLLRLEAAIGAMRGATLPSDGAAPVEQDADRAAQGRIRLSVRIPGTDWRLDRAPEALLDADWSTLSARAAQRLAALGHPARIAILHAALSGITSGPALRQASGATTPGQFYHHLRELTAAGWLVAERRGVHAVPSGRVGPLLAALALVQTD